MKILVRMSNWLGDVVMGLPALDRLSELYPDSRLAVLVPRPLRELLAHHPGVHELVELDIHGGRLAPLALGRQLRDVAADRAYLFTNSFSSALGMWWARIPERIGYAHEGRSPLLTHAIPRDRAIRQRHMVHYYLNLIEPGGAWEQSYRPRIHLLPDEKEWAEAFLRSSGIDPGDWVVGLNPGAVGGTAKRWPPERYAELARRLVCDRNAFVLLFGSRDERPLAEEIARASGVATLNVAGRTSLRQLTALMAHCNLVITNDSGGMHVADAAGARVMALVGPTIIENTRPFGREHILLRESVDCSPYAQPCMQKECPIDHRCMHALTVDHVWQALP